MADGRTVTIAVDIVTGPNAGAKVKSAVNDVERGSKGFSEANIRFPKTSRKDNGGFG
jgi:hypothetical protein